MSGMAEMVSLSVQGMHCASCVGRAEKAIRAQPGVLDAAINLANGTAHVVTQGAQVDRLTDALTEAGYPATLRQSAAEVTDHGAEAAGLWRAFCLALVLTLPVFLAEMGGHLIPAVHHAIMQSVGLQTSWVLQFLLITAVLAGPGAVFFRTGWPALRRGAPEMNTLVMLGAGAAWIYSSVATFTPALLPSASRAVYFEAAGVIVTLILLGRYLEARAKRQAGAAIAGLMDLQPDMATVLENGEARVKPISELLPGYLVQIKPGERIPVDGQIEDGASDIDEAMLTGEPLPVAKSAGDPVTAGTLNGSGSFTFRVTAVGADTVLAKIIDSVDRAQAAKLPVQSAVDRITLIFVPIVMGLAVLSCLGWLMFGGTLAQALVAAVSVLIIACPCAMGLAVPVSVVVATGRAAQLGILFRGGDGLQRLADIDAVAFDKTGTLTTGTPEVQFHEVLGESDVLDMIATVEARSEHPLARALSALGRTDPDVTEFKSETGQGVRAQVGGTSVLIGARRYLETAGIDLAPLAQAEARALEAAATPVFAALDGEVRALVAVADPVKPEAEPALRDLSNAQTDLALLSGDRQEVAETIAGRLGIASAAGGLLPEDKLARIRDMQTGGTVAFVGDGINDAPALAQADVGIALASGTDIAMDAADVVIMSGRLDAVPRAVSLSRTTLRNIRQNLFWAFGYNVVLIPVAMGAFYPVFGWQLSPMLGAAAMALSSVFVVTNALRLRRAG